MKTIKKTLITSQLLAAAQVFAGNAYQCPSSTPVDSLHNRSGWYVGEYTPETGSYSASVGSTQTLTIKADALIDTATSPHTWAQDTNGNATAVLATGSYNLSAPNSPTFSTAIVGLNAVAPNWLADSAQSQWPELPRIGAMHGLLIQRNHLKSNANSARRSHAIQFAQDYFEYRLVGSSDTTIDGISIGDLELGGETLKVEIATEYIAPPGWGDNDYCSRLFNNRNGSKGFEVQLRPVIYVLGENLSEIADLPNISGDYTGTIELAYDSLPTSRPVY